jgi:hypothetical protein
MHDFATVLGNAVTGLFALLGAFLAWRLRRKDDEGDRRALLAREKQKDLVDLYAQTFTSLELAMKCATEHEPYELTAERSLVNAKLRLLGSTPVNLAYDDVADKLRDWSRLHVAASPQRTKIGDQTVVLIQSPDPTEKYKVPAQEAYKALHDALRLLRKRMQNHLNDT